MVSRIPSSSSLKAACQQTPPATDGRLWRYPIGWVLVGGPVLVVVASIVTAIIAINGQDEVLDRRADPSSRGRGTPAVEGRNHAVTPIPSGPASHAQ